MDWFALSPDAGRHVGYTPATIRGSTDATLAYKRNVPAPATGHGCSLPISNCDEDGFPALMPALLRARRAKAALLSAQAV